MTTSAISYLFDEMPIQKDSAKRPEQPSACIPIHLWPMALSASAQFSYSPLPLSQTPDHLLSAMLAAPQFAKVPVKTLMKQQRGSLQVIFVTESDYYARQAAVYLTTLNTLYRRQLHPEHCEKSNPEDDLLSMFSQGDDEEEEAAPQKRLKESLVVLEPKLLDPALNPPPQQRPSAEQLSVVNLSHIDAPAFLIAAETGPVLTAEVLRQLRLFRQKASIFPADLFITLHPSQIDREMLEELRFTYGFSVVEVGTPDNAYYDRLLHMLADDLMIELSPDLSISTVVSNLRRYRGSAFSELDFESLLNWTIQKKQADHPLTENDLSFAPYSTAQTSRHKLEQMIGLTDVKEKLRRILAGASLDQRRRQAGHATAPTCRNLAFSGPSGTGKSVTARLIAKIMQEEGCGSGRFVEAGREQLIGTYLGQTSPQIAALFESARGGVLFIDEVGALLDPSGHDSYAAEAINALVRHMELEPETMVIFATYPKEIERFISTNIGLSSRIMQVLHFESYTDEELFAILALHAKEAGYTLPSGADVLCKEFFKTLRDRKKEQFGNGREARRLFETALEELALRTEQSPDAPLRFHKADFEKACAYLLKEPKKKEHLPIGFRI